MKLVISFSFILLLSILTGCYPAVSNTTESPAPAPSTDNISQPVPASPAPAPAPAPDPSMSTDNTSEPVPAAEPEPGPQEEPSSRLSPSDRVPRITIEELRQKIESGADITIVDSRVDVDEQFEIGHITGAVPVPLTEITSGEWIPPADIDQEIIFYCT